ncbi:NUDIX hydrolase [Umezawaea tangerina]|uniref:ADP-ribose pyrophosphatase YjhB (NUDIX family) n=1 Tax=Umezawaea tangerina TaxID=84725 RepID=A0A2T0TMA9_9PSEU|nr:NUDIX hydrolase [Umezawaea tangerina]PRY46789.1 ADP-ribose pyrophosphatase YjhB (NUDIX family) [Umezawaea tangerina]
MEITKQLRVAAYALCVRDGRILLSRWVGPGGNNKRWTLPGGGIDHGEDPYEAVIREVDEETGYAIEVRRLLGVHTIRRTFERGPDAEVDFHGLRIIYEAEVVGGELRFEVGGSSDRAEWFDLADVAGLRHSDQVDVALELARTSPPDGRGEVALPSDERLTREGPAARTGPPPGS